jgi:hypothetical protein
MNARCVTSIGVFPNWKFKLVARTDQKGDPSFSACTVESNDRGSGIAVEISDFYVTIPSAANLVNGLFEQPSSLGLAVFYRDRINQNIVDRMVASTIRRIVPATKDGPEMTKVVAQSLLNEAWDWQPTKRPHK